MSTVLTCRPFAEQDRLVFLHLPKTAGTSFVRVLLDHFVPQDVCPAYLHDELARLPPQTIAAYRLIRGHFFYDAIASLSLDNSAWITFLRDPVERVLSTYAHMQNHPDVLHHPWGAGKTLEEFLNHPLARAHVTNLQTRRLAAHLQMDTWEWLEEALERETEEVLAGRWPRAEEAMRVLAGMTFFGLTERFDESMALLAYTFAWPPLPAGPRLNVAPSRPEQEAVPASLLDQIVALNQEDLALYEFARRLFDERHSALLPNLLDDHYRRTNCALAAPRVNHFVAFGGPLPTAVGWYGPEGPPACPDGWRWLGPDPEATLDLPLAIGSDLRVRLCVTHAISPDILESLRLSANDWPIALTHEAADERGKLILVGTIPAAALAAFPGSCRLTFQVARTIAPASQNPASRDTRRLGVAVAWVKVEPAPDT